MKQETDWQLAHPGIRLSNRNGRRAGTVEDEGGQVGVQGGQRGRKGSTNAVAVDHDFCVGNLATFVQVLQGVCGVFGHAGLVGPRSIALAVSAVVKGKDVQTEIVEERDGFRVVWTLGKGSITAPQVKHCQTWIMRESRRSNPQTGEPGRAGFCGVKVYRLGGEPRKADEGLGRPGRVQDELPLTLIKEQAKGEVATKQGSYGDHPDSFQKPDGIDDFDLCGRLLGGGAGSFLRRHSSGFTVAG